MKLKMIRSISCLIFINLSQIHYGQQNEPNFFEAIEQENLPLIETYLKKGVPINKPSDDYDSLTPLQYAVEKGKLNAVSFLLKKGARIDYRGVKTYSPLFLAVMNRDIKILQWLIQHGADVNFREPETGQTPLHHAAYFSGQFDEYIEIVQLLLSKGAFPNSRDSDGKTPLLEALKVNFKKFKIIQLFIQYKADINARDKEGRTPLHYAVDTNYENVEILELILKNHGDVHAQTYFNKFTPLLAAANKDSANPDVILLLLKYKSNINAKDYLGDTALHIAVKSNNLPLVKLLIENGANPSLKNKDGLTPFAVSHDCVDDNQDELYVKNYLSQKGFRLSQNEVKYVEKMKKSSECTNGETRRPNQKQKKTESMPEERKKNSAAEILKTLLGIILSLGYFGLSMYLREKVYLANPLKNGFGSFNGFLGSALLGALIIGGFASLIDPGGANFSEAFGNLFTNILVGGLIGFGMGGTLAGFNLKHFKENRVLYYLSAALISGIAMWISIILIN